MLQSQIQLIDIGLLDDHPDNPRIVWRQEVIDGIAAQLEAAGVFDPAHALLVRPVDGRYQIVRGHHRRQAAVKAGLTDVPCWVRDMTDDEAFMQLALGNVQGELSPLELGLHALKAVEPGERGRGKVGGFGEYGRQLGKTPQYIGQVRQAAEVYEATKIESQLSIFLDKSQHLSAIYNAPRDLWTMLVEWMLAEDLTVRQVEDLVKRIKRYAIPDEWRFFLPLSDVVAAYLRNDHPSPDDVADIVTGAEGIKRLIVDHGQALDPAVFSYTVDAFKDWLTKGIGSYSWDKAALFKYRQGVLIEAQTASKPKPIAAELGKWYALGRHRLYCGDTSDPAFIDKLPSAKFAFADPPYNAGVADWDHDFEWKHDYLIDKAEIVAVTPGIAAIAKFFRDDTTMPYRWSITCWITNGMTRGALGFGNWIYVALFSNETIHQGSQDMFKTEENRQSESGAIKVSIQTGETDNSDHKGRKPSGLLTELIALFTEPNDTVIDPFLGSGTTLFAADDLGRVCYGGEINPAFCNDMIKRWQDKTGMQAVEQ